MKHFNRTFRTKIIVTENKGKGQNPRRTRIEEWLIPVIIIIMMIIITNDNNNNKMYYKIIQIVRALWLAIKPFYMSVCKHGNHFTFLQTTTTTNDYNNKIITTKIYLYLTVRPAKFKSLFDLKSSSSVWIQEATSKYPATHLHVTE